MNGEETPIAEEFLPALVAPAAEELTLSPYSFEFRESDGLRLTVVASVSARVHVHYRMRTRAGVILSNVYTASPTFDRVINEFEFTIGAGYLLNVTVSSSGVSDPPYGSMWASLRALHGRGASATVVATLVQGYITREHERAWPGSTLQAAREGAGYVYTRVGTNPAAGATIAETVPDNARWELQSLRIILTTDATVANRQIVIILGDAIRTLLQIIGSATQPASTTYTYECAQGMPFTGALAQTIVPLPLPRAFELGPTDRILVGGFNLQAGDDFAAPVLRIREWLDPQVIPPI